MRTAILLLFTGLIGLAQPQTTLTPQGFTPVTFDRPQVAAERLIEASKSWSDAYNKISYDVYNVTPDGLSIDALRENAFFYRTRGEVFKYSILYALQVKFGEQECQVQFVVKEIYADKTRIASGITDYFAPDGTMKEGFEQVKPSIEDTANKIIQSYVRAVSR